jgi:hypothetical protein
MPRNPSGSDEPPRSTDAAIAELWRQMVSRDELMWQQLTQRDTELQGRMIDLFSRLLEANSVDRVLANGLGELSDQLKEQMAPLRELTRARIDLSDFDDRRLASLNRALSRPNYGGPPESEAPFWIQPESKQPERRSYTQ